jgi:hypothetical protein
MAKSRPTSSHNGCNSAWPRNFQRHSRAGGDVTTRGTQVAGRTSEEARRTGEVDRTRDEERRQSGTDPKKKPAQMPTTDPQSKVMPNKEGGFAPNYTPTALTDGESGIILDSNVLDVVNESGHTLPAVDRVTELCGAAPENFLSDGGNASGEILAGLQKREINAVVPVKSIEPAADSPALRDDLTQPVPAN